MAKTGAGDSGKHSLLKKEPAKEEEDGEVRVKEEVKFQPEKVVESSVDAAPNGDEQNNVVNVKNNDNTNRLTECECIHEYEKIFHDDNESSPANKKDDSAVNAVEHFTTRYKYAVSEILKSAIDKEAEQNCGQISHKSGHSENTDNADGDQFDCNTFTNNTCANEPITPKEELETISLIKEEIDINSTREKEKKTLVNNFLAKDDSILQSGSVDHAEDVHTELERLQQETSDKTLEEEFHEVKGVQQARTVDDSGDSATDTDAEKESIKENQLDIFDNKPVNIFEDSIDETHEGINHLIVEETAITENISDTAESDISLNCLKEELIIQNTSIPLAADAVHTESKNTEAEISQSEELTKNNREEYSVSQNSDYDADSSDTEQIERTNELKAKLYSCLKGKFGSFEKSSSGQNKRTNCESDSHLQQNDELDSGVNVANGRFENKQLTTLESELHLIDQSLDMPETREDLERSVSPSLMFASTRYRWEKTIVTQSPTVVFVTLNKKEIEPVQLAWSESAMCFYSDEVKIPVGVYVGNLVIDGAFYPVEDITVKHYTFEVDLYLKDDILEDEKNGSGVEKAEEFVRKKNQSNSQEPGKQDFTYTPTRASNYSSSRSRMEEEQNGATQGEGGIHLSNKYEELVRSQMNHSKGGFSDGDADNSDLEGRRTPVGEDGSQQYQDGGDTEVKTVGNSLSKTAKSAASYDPLIDDFFENRSSRTHSSVQNGYDSVERKTSPAVIDDVLGNGHTRSPIYSTESPVYSKHSSAHSSARQTPTAQDGRELGRPESVGSAGSGLSANSVSKHVLDDLLSDAFGKSWSPNRALPGSEQREGSWTGSTPTRPESVGSVHSENSVSRRGINDIIEDSLNITKTPPPSRESSIHGSRPTTPPATEQISDVLNPADRHSPIRREYLAGSQNLSNHSGKISNQGSAHNSVPSSAHSSAPGSQRQTPQRELLSNSLRASQEKLYSSQEIRRLSGSVHSGERPGSDMNGHLSAGSNASSRPQSLTSEQELSQYYENLAAENKSSINIDNFGVAGPRTGSASSLPAIGNQQRYTPDKRSLTPDYHVRVPVVGPIPKTSLVPNRTPPRTPISNASSRTVTPMNTETETEGRLRDQIKDLENTVSNMRKLLSSREQEVSELKDQFSEVRDINEKLQGDLDRHRARASPGPQIAEFERKLREACEERDGLAEEVSRLKEEIRQKQEPSLNHYDPNSPSALKRKIDELNSHIQDLQEAHDAASLEIESAEKKVKELAAENEKLRMTQAEKVKDTEDENRHLKSEIHRLRESHVGHSEATDFRLKIELQQVKDDNRNLRERNYQLHDDNLRLKEELSDLRKSLDLVGSARKSLKIEGKPARKYDAFDRTDTEKSVTVDTSYRSDLDYSLRPDPISERLTDRDYTSSISDFDERPRYDTKPVETRPLHVDRFTKSDSSRYESYRTGPDGGSSEKVRSSTSGYSQPLTPERTSIMGFPKRDNSMSQDRLNLTTKTLDRSELGSRTLDRDDLRSRTLDRGDLGLGRARKERSRTCSAEVEFRSMPRNTFHGDLSKTTPALSGRSREIYQEISYKRSKNVTMPSIDLDDRIQNHCESAENNPKEDVNNPKEDVNNPKETENNPKVTENNPKTENTNNHGNKARTSQVFMNRYIPPNEESKREITDSDSRSHIPENMSEIFAKREACLSQQRQTLEKEVKHLEKQVLLSSLADDGNMSDTATDILVNIQPVDKISGTSWGHNRQRRGSVGSDASNSSFSDIDEQLTASVRKRSKSADGREILRRMGPTGKENMTLSRTLSPAPSAGLRTVTPRPIATQHNKSGLSLSTSLNSLTQGLRPFAPRSAQDLQISDVIKFSRQGGKLSQGTIKFIGHLPGRGDIYLGVELDKEDGKHDGVFEGIRYFKCKPTKGVFVAYNKVVMAWTY